MKTKLKSEASPEEEKILNELLELLEKLAIDVRYDRGHFKGGLVRYRDHLYLYLNRKAPTKNKIELIIEELKHIHIPESMLSEKLQHYFSLNH